MKANVIKLNLNQCKKCGKTDHLRASNKKCPFFVKKIKTTNFIKSKHQYANVAILPKNSNAKLSNQNTITIKKSNEQRLLDMENKVIIN